MDKQKNYIIGGGPAGLIAGFFLKDFSVISKKSNLGGQLSSSFQLGPRLVRTNTNFKTLLDMLGVDNSERNVTVGYYANGNILSSLTEEMKNEYSLRTRQSNTQLSTSMNDGLGEMTVIDFDSRFLISKLESVLENRLINSNVTHINPSCHTLVLDGSNERNYSQLVSTIHYLDFCKLLGESSELKFSDIHFFLSPKSPVAFDDKYSFLYCIDDNLPFTRITPFNKGFVLEGARELTSNEITQYEITNSKVLKNHKLSRQYRLIGMGGVNFFGRYAELDSEIRMHNLVDNAIKLKQRLRVKHG